MLNKVICVCTLKDADTFSLATKFIRKYIKASRYVVIVPESEYEYFIALELVGFDVISEKKYSRIALSLSELNLGSRFGWYFQQFIKMSELDDGKENDINLIWDADTIPLREIDFIKDGLVYFYQGKELHSPYFKLIKALLDEDKLLPTSFIAQCLPYKVGWFKSFKQHIEKEGNLFWFERIINLIDINESSGFSEYETLGTYALRLFSDQMKISNRTDNWYRYGNSLIGSPKNLYKHLNELKKKYNYISFESWDTKTSGFAKRFAKLKMKFNLR